MGVLAICFSLAAPPERPEPTFLVADALPPGAVARLGPDEFRYAAWDASRYSGGPPVRYSADGKYVAVDGWSGIVVWDADTGKRRLTAYRDGVWVPKLVGLSSSREVVLAWGATVNRVDLPTGRVTGRSLLPGDRNIAAVSPDGKTVYSFTSPGNAFAVETVANDVDSGKELWRTGSPCAVAMWVSSDGSRLITRTSRDNQPATVTETVTGRTIEMSTEQPAWEVTGRRYDNVFLTRDGKKAVLVRMNRLASDVTFDVEVWDAAARRRLSTATADVGSEPALSPDGTTLATGSSRANRGAVQFYDVATGNRLPRSPEPFKQAVEVWYQPDGTLASADAEFTRPVAWHINTGAMTPLPAGTRPFVPVRTWPGFNPPAGTDDVTLAPDRTRAFGYRLDPDEQDSVAGDTYFGLFDGTGRVLVRYPIQGNQFAPSKRVCEFTPDSKAFAVARRDGTITLYDAADGKELRAIRHAGKVISMAFSPDGTRLATACDDGPILVWDVAAKR